MRPNWKFRYRIPLSVSSFRIIATPVFQNRSYPGFSQLRYNYDPCGLDSTFVTAYVFSLLGLSGAVSCEKAYIVCKFVWIGSNGISNCSGRLRETPITFYACWMRRVGGPTQLLAYFRFLNSIIMLKDVTWGDGPSRYWSLIHADTRKIPVSSDLNLSLYRAKTVVLRPPTFSAMRCTVL